MPAIEQTTNLPFKDIFEVISENYFDINLQRDQPSNYNRYH